MVLSVEVLNATLQLILSDALLCRVDLILLVLAQLVLLFYNGIVFSATRAHCSDDFPVVETGYTPVLGLFGEDCTTKDQNFDCPP